jgi:hypothetical protein
LSHAEFFQDFFYFLVGELVDALILISIAAEKVIQSFLGGFGAGFEFG